MGANVSKYSTTNYESINFANSHMRYDLFELTIVRPINQLIIDGLKFHAAKLLRQIWMCAAASPRLNQAVNSLHMLKCWILHWTKCAINHSFWEDIWLCVKENKTDNSTGTKSDVFKHRLMCFWTKYFSIHLPCSVAAWISLAFYYTSERSDRNRSECQMWKWGRRNGFFNLQFRSLSSSLL